MSPTRLNSIVLFEDGEDVFVNPQDNDKFVLTAQDAVRACRAWDKGVQFGRQFEELLNHLSRWIEQNRVHISVAKLNVRQNDILFVVTQKVVERDDVLADQLTELDLEIATDQRFDLISLNVLSLPLVDSESAAAFLSSGEILTHAE